MAVLSISCPRCSARYTIDEAHRGKKAKCKKADCGTTFVIGETSTQPRAAGASPSKEMAAAKERPRGEDGIPLDWEPGDLILDQYEVVPLPGTKRGHAEGGMGRVNLVFHRQWRKQLAVKSVLPARSASAGDLENFKAEAEQWVEKIGLHPNIVACHYVRILGDVPRVFIEYVEGGTLQEWITSGRLYEGGPQAALERILDVAIQAAWGLHYVHELGLIHQDVKPLNVMMTADGVAKVTDFGLAAARSAAFEGNGPRPAGTTILATYGGRTLPYCSWEQADIAAKRDKGVPREQWPKLTRRTDIWSWAVSLLHLFVRELPPKFEGQTAPFLLEAYLRSGDRDEELPALPGAVADVLRHCFQKRPEDRPRDLMQVAEKLRSIYQQATGQPNPREQPNAGEALADTLNNRAVSLFDLGKKAEAEQKWQEALRVEPHHPETTYNWGLIQWRSARMTDQKLLENLREARASSADSARVDYLTGLVHLERADAKAAVNALSKAAEAGTSRAEITAALTVAQSRYDPSEDLLRSFEGHTGSVRAVAWSPDGRYALSGNGGAFFGIGDTTVRLWDVATGQCLRSFEGHTGSVDAVSWSPDGRYALSGGGGVMFGAGDRTMRLWDVSSGQCLRIFEGHTHHVLSVSWSPDGRFALSASYDKTLRLWDATSGQCVRTFEGHTEPVWSASWSPDGHYILSGSYDQTLRLWEVTSGQCLRTFAGHSAGVESVSWSPDGRYALSGSRDMTLRLWEVSSGECLRTFAGHRSYVPSVAWSPDGLHALSSGSNDKTMRLWEVSSGRCLRTFEEHTGVGLTEWVTAVSWSPDGRYALSGGSNKALRLRRIALARQAAPLVISMASTTGSALYHRLLQQARDTLASDPAVAAGFLQQARQQPGCSRRKESLELARWLSRSLAHRRFMEGWEKRTFEGHTHYVTWVSWSPDGRQALSGSFDRTLRLWDASTGVCQRTFEGHTGAVQSVEWSPDGRWAVSASADKTLRLWDVCSGQCLRTLEGHTQGVSTASWSPDGRWILSVSDDETLRLWEAASGACLRTFRGRGSYLFSVAWSPDGRHALVGGKGEKLSLSLWDVAGGQCLRTFEGHSAGVEAVSWSPDGRYALSGSRDNTFRLWGVSSGECLRTFTAHSGWVRSVAWSPDGRYALSSSEDGTMRLWDMASGQCLRTFEGHTDRLSSVSWNPEGRYVLSASCDKTLRLWELDWEFEANQPADWDEGARPFLSAFLAVHVPHVDGLSRWGKPTWTEDDFRRLLDRLACAGFGWLRPEGVRRELAKMASAWQESSPPIKTPPLVIQVLAAPSLPPSAASTQASPDAPPTSHNSATTTASPASHPPARPPGRALYGGSPAHPGSDPDAEARRNIELCKARARWQQLPWWKKWFTPYP